VISRLTHITHALPTPRAWAANIMLLSGANLASLLVYLRIIPQLKEMGLKFMNRFQLSQYYIHK
jgi:hypothetical protein